jgi:hypothetical protein
VPKIHISTYLHWTQISEISFKQLSKTTLLHQEYPKSVCQNYGASGNASKSLISFMDIELVITRDWQKG